MSNLFVPPGSTPAIAQERNYRRIESTRQLAAYDHQFTDRQTQIPGVLFAAYRLGNPTPYTYVLRPDAPRMGDDGKMIKYEWPARVPLCLDVLPRYRDALGDVTIPIWITEGAKKADALASAFGNTIVPINVNGVWGWRRKEHDGSKHPLEDLDAIAWAGRRVVLAFDNDVTRKAEVQDALRALQRHLVKERGAVVSVLILPYTGEKMGVDDALAAGMTSDELRSYVDGLDGLDRIDGLDDLPPDELKRRLRAVIAERDQWKERAEQLQLQLGDVQEHNRFMTQAQGAEGIESPSMRLTFIELKRELDRVPVEEREPDQFVLVRSGYMAACTGQDRSTVGRHLSAFKAAGLIEKATRRSYDRETEKWSTDLFVRPLVDLSDPSHISIPSKPRGMQGCRRCGSTRITRQVIIECPDCGLREESEPVLVNYDDEPAGLQFAIQTDPAVEAQDCNLQHKESTPDPLSSGLQIAILPDPAPLAVPRSRMSSLPADDWLAYLADTGQYALLEQVTARRPAPA